MKLKPVVLKQITSWSIRTQLVALVLTAVLPVVAVLFYNGLRHRRDLIADAQTNTLHLVQNIAFQQESEVEGIRQLLIALARHPAIQTRNVAECNALLRDILKLNPRNLNLGIVTPEGLIFASGQPITPFSLNVSSRKYFQEVVRTGSFSSGEFVIGKTTGQPNIHFAYPVLDAAGRFQGVLYASFLRGNFDSLLTKMKLPAGAVLNLTDHKGIILYRNLEPERYIGLQDVPNMRAHVAGKEKEGSFFDSGIDGVFRLYSFKQLMLPDEDRPYLYIRVGIPENEALKRANSELIISLFLTGTTAFLAFFIAWHIGNYIIIRRLNKLVNAVRELGKGNLKARTGIADTQGELGLLARAFDEMGESLEQHEDEQRKLIAIIENASDLAGIADISGSITYANRSTLETLGLGTMSEASRENFFNILFPEDKKKFLQEILPALYRDGIWSGEYRAINKKTGETIHLEMNALLTRDTVTGKPVSFANISRNVTERKKSQEERERLIAELQQALANVKILSGFLPICSICKKIRNDSGYWQQVEEYMTSHSEAVFSHGMCPDCVRKLYPDIADEVLKD